VELLYKPDFEEAARRWQAFWAGELLDRPPTVITARRQGAPEQPPIPQIVGLDGDFTTPIDNFESWAETIYFAGEALPCFVPSFGTAQCAGFLGGEIITLPESGDTSWSAPCVTDLEEFLPIELDPDNIYWRRMLDFYRTTKQRATGKYLVGTLDIHLGVDVLSALRGPQCFLMDLVDRPEIVDIAVEQATDFFPQIFNATWEAGGMNRFGWSSDWCGMGFPARGTITQSDFSAMISPEMFRRWVLPAFEAEWEYLDYNFYHLDGPDALVHLPDLLAEPKLHGIQWVPGDGNAPQHTWVDIFHRIQAAGKSVEIWGDIEAIKWVHPQLKPDLVPGAGRDQPHRSRRPARVAGRAQLDIRLYLPLYVYLNDGHVLLPGRPLLLRLSALVGCSNEVYQN